MSWLLGFVGASLSPKDRERLAAVHGPARLQRQREHLYLAAGGPDATCRYSERDEQTGWLVCGLGLRPAADHTELLDSEAWERLLITSEPSLQSLDGHFAAVRWHHDEVMCFTDPLGLRPLYHMARVGGRVFSTRLDWLVALRGGAAIDYATLGAHWLAFSQLQATSLVQGIERIGPGGHAVFTPISCRTSSRPWTPDFTRRDGEYVPALQALLRPRGAQQRLSLGLSGGLDSRLLLALHPTPRAVGLHVFGPPAHPDVRVAHHVAAGEHFPLRHLHEPVPGLETCLELVRAHASQTHAYTPASAVLGLRYYPALHQDERLVIDGGFGEIARRRFMNRLRRRGRPAMLRGDLKALLGYLRAPRVDVFRAEILTAMHRGMREQLAACWEGLPDPGAVGAGNVLDLLCVRTKLATGYAYEQQRLDGLVVSYMPFVQPSFLHALFQTPLAQRSSRAARRLIRTHRPTLARYPLVLGRSTHPFWLPIPAAHLWTGIKTRLGLAYIDERQQTLLKRVRPFVLDLVHSRAVREADPYDPAKLTGLVEGYYAGQTALAPQVDWWLSFELWRQSLTGTDA